MNIDLDTKKFIDAHKTTKLYCVYDTVQEEYVAKIFLRYIYSDSYESNPSGYYIYSLEYSITPQPSGSSPNIEIAKDKLLHFSSITKNPLVLREFNIDINYQNLAICEDIITVSKLIYETHDKNRKNIIGKNIIKLLETDLEKSNKYLILISIPYDKINELNSNIKKIFNTKPKQFIKLFNTYGYMLLINDIKSLAILKLWSDDLDLKIIDRTANMFVGLHENGK